MSGDPPLLDSGRFPPAKEAPIDLNALVEPWIGVSIVGLGIGLVVLFLTLVALLAWQARRIGRLRRRVDGLTRGTEGHSLEAVLDAHLDKVSAVSRELDEFNARAAAVEANGRRAVQRMALVRFNPFEETGGNQSFALALLDANGDGIVVSSLHARASTRVYARTVMAGTSAATLSDEEADAVRQALRGATATVGRS